MPIVKGQIFPWVLSVALSLLIFFLDLNALLPIHAAVQRVTTPIRSGLFETREFVLSPFQPTEDSKVNLGSLQEENAQLVAQLSKLAALQEENEHLRKLLGADTPSYWKFSPARVVTEFSDKLYVTSEQELKEGLPAVVAKDDKERNFGVLVGKLEQVVGKEVRVILPTHPSSKISVIVRGSQDRQRRAKGLALGKGGEVWLDQVLAKEVLSQGDLIVTSGEGLPPELLIGYVGEIFQRESAVVQGAKIVPAVFYSELKFVSFVTEY